jgi:Cdc6-like AAA superfamily ATPase
VGKKVKGLWEEIERYYVDRMFLRRKDGKTEKLNEVKMLAEAERLVIVEGEPGLGKTVTLAHAAKAVKDRHGSGMWVVEINADSLSGQGCQMV